MVAITFSNLQRFQFFRDMILRALEKAGGIKSKAASLLKLNRTTLIEKMKKMGLMSSN